MEDKIAQITALVQDALSTQNYDMVKTAFAEASNSYLIKYCKEESFAEKIFTPNTITDPGHHPNIQIDMQSDSYYYWEPVEVGAKALEVSDRGQRLAAYVNGQKWQMRFAPASTDPVKKTYDEMLAAPSLMDMIRNNNAEQMRRLQDSRFMMNVNAALEENGKVIHGNWDADGEVSVNKTDIMRIRNAIKLDELNPSKMLMSSVAYEYLYPMNHEEIGAAVTEIFFGGIESRDTIAGNKVIKTVKTSLTDTNGVPAFDYVDEQGRQHIRIYAFADEKYLGRFIKLGADQTYAKWEGHIFSFYSRKNFGIGFADVRGVAVLDIIVPNIFDAVTPTTTQA